MGIPTQIITDQFNQMVGYIDENGNRIPASFAGAANQGALNNAVPSAAGPTAGGMSEQALLNYGVSEAGGAAPPTAGGMNPMSLLSMGSGMIPTGGRNSGMSDVEAGIGGAAAGAMAGAPLGPPGMIAGAVLGGGSSLLGNSGKSDNQRMQEKMQKIQYKQMKDDYVRGQRKKKTEGAEDLVRVLMAPFIGIT